MTAEPTFLKLPNRSLTDLDGASIVVVGASEASPYSFEPHSHSADAPGVLRQVSASLAGSLTQYDFDLGTTLLPQSGDSRGIVDAGDIPTDPADAEGNRARIRSAVADVLNAGAIPIVLGGDDSVPIPVIAAYEGRGPLIIVQVDAHVDWADVIDGNAYGYGSPMRRAAEFPWVTGMAQYGIRGLGSGQRWQHDDARAWGSRLLTSYDIHRDGIDAALRHVPEGARVFISIDCDGIDPAVFPAVNMPTPGGLSYEDMVLLLRGIAARADIAGLALLEYVPERDDAHRLSAHIAVRLVTAVIASIVEARDGRGDQKAGVGYSSWSAAEAGR